ncbi:MAG: bifunctional nuclease family protein [Opitutaceae bacterium]|jgi:bifunctional DNase/RNase|nr:bifunctional nuclease family protein [Opitutaceae bacterium]
MPNEPIPVRVKAVLPAANGAAVFLGDKERTFVIHMDIAAAKSLQMTISGEKKERPLTHDLFASLLDGLGADIAHVLINRVENGVFFARVVVRMENELGQKWVELDARPSDALPLAIKRRRPILVSQSVLDGTEDATELLEHLRHAAGKDEEDNGSGDADDAGSTPDPSGK